MLPIEVIGISKSFPLLNSPKSYLQVLQEVSFSVRKGEVVFIIGPSGVGKTVLLNCIAGLIEIDKGEIKIDGETTQRRLNGRPIKIPADAISRRYRTAMVFQHLHLWPHKTILENVAEPLLVVHKKSKEEAQSRALEELERVKLEDKANDYPQTISGGQQQRAAIARALVTEPQIILMDEITSALDPELTGEVLEVIKSLAEQHYTMLMITHEINFAKELADRVTFLCDGRIVEQGTPEEVLTRPKNERTRVFLKRYFEGLRK